MGRKQTLIFREFFFGLLLFVQIHSSFISAGYHYQIALVLLAIPLILSLVPGSLFFRRYTKLWFVVLLFCAVWFLWIRAITEVNCAFPQTTICSISGRVVYDSSFSTHGNHLMKVFISDVGSVYGQSGTAKGLVSVIGKEKAIISSGIRIRLDGKFSNGLFIYENIQVLDRSMINDIREYFMMVLESGLMNSDGSISQAELLSMMLILGRAEYYKTPVRALSESCGCLHVLALSGMHLHVVTAPVRFVKNKKVSYFLSILIASVFVFVAGPRPSLIRSWLMLVFRPLPIYENLLVSFLIQSFVFPISMVDLGAVYGYASVFALVLFAPYIQVVFGKLPLFISSSVAVILVNAPIQLAVSGIWHPVSIVAGPVVSFLAYLSMLFGFAILFLGKIPFLIRCNDCIFRTMNITLTKFSSGDFPFRDSSWKGYCILISVFMAFCLILLRRRNRIRRLGNFVPPGIEEHVHK